MYVRLGGHQNASNSMMHWRVGTEVTYRCVDCNECWKCKNGLRLESLSIQEEVEEALISRSVTVELDEGVSSAKLPFVVNPDGRISVEKQK